MDYCYCKCCCTEMAPVLGVTWNITFQVRNKAQWNSMSYCIHHKIYESIQVKRRGKKKKKSGSYLHCFHLDHAYLSLALLILPKDW